MAPQAQKHADRLTFAIMIMVPIMQLVLFGFAINSDPKNLRTAVLDADPSVFSRSFVRALGLIKGAAAQANKELGLLDGAVADAIGSAANTRQLLRCSYGSYIEPHEGWHA